MHGGRRTRHARPDKTDRKAYLEEQIQRQKRGEPIDVEWVTEELQRIRREQVARMQASQRNLRWLVIGAAILIIVLWARSGGHARQGRLRDARLDRDRPARGASRLRRGPPGLSIGRARRAGRRSSDVARLTEQRGDLVAARPWPASPASPPRLFRTAPVSWRATSSSTRAAPSGSLLMPMPSSTASRTRSSLDSRKIRVSDGSAPTKSVLRSSASAASTTDGAGSLSALRTRSNMRGVNTFAGAPHDRRPHLGRCVLEQPLERAAAPRRRAPAPTASAASATAGRFVGREARIRELQQRAQRRPREDRVIRVLGDQPGQHRDRIAVQLPLDQVVAPDVHVAVASGAAPRETRAPGARRGGSDS